MVSLECRQKKKHRHGSAILLRTLSFVFALVLWRVRFIRFSDSSRKKSSSFCTRRCGETVNIFCYQGNREEGPICWSTFRKMALNPQLFPNGTPVPFVGEMFVLTRDSVEFQVKNVPDTPGGKFVAKGTILISNVRIVFVASKPVGHIAAFDLPLLYIHEEKFNQPILFCNNLTGKCHPVVPDGEHASLYGIYDFKILFKEGGVGTFVPLFFNLLRSVRGVNYEVVNPSAPPLDPLPSEQAPVDEMIRHAYMDPNDPTKLYLQQPFDAQPSLRRRTYKASLPEEGQL